MEQRYSVIVLEDIEKESINISVYDNGKCIVNKNINFIRWACDNCERLQQENREAYEVIGEQQKIIERYQNAEIEALEMIREKAGKVESLKDKIKALMQKYGGE